MRVWIEFDKGLEVPLCDKCSALLFLSGVLPDADCFDCLSVMFDEASKVRKKKHKKKQRLEGIIKHVNGYYIKT